jgi:hypothetical protein
MVSDDDHGQQSKCWLSKVHHKKNKKTESQHDPVFLFKLSLQTIQLLTREEFKSY